MNGVRQNCFICKLCYNFFSDDIAAFANHLQSEPLLTYTLSDDERYSLNRTKPLTPTAIEIAWLHPITGIFKIYEFHLASRTSPLSPEIICQSAITASTSSSQSIDSAYSWFTTCRQYHDSCNRLVKSSQWYPTRLIDVGLNKDPQWKLVLPREEDIQQSEYMTLSYRWGFRPFLALTKSTMRAFLDGQPVEDLPTTFRDAIMICRRFSIRYLWIDTLCIQQDSPKDWARESTKMREVYANSACNIVAAASANPYGGLFRARAPSDINPGLVQASWDGCPESEYWIWDKDYADRQVSKVPLHMRGWVLQERLLAPRTLHFAEMQIFWECETDFRCEGFREGLPFYSPFKNFDALFSNDQPKPLHGYVMSYEAFECWSNIIQYYSRCGLTNPEDKLIALSGITHLFLERLGEHETYLAGHWKSRLPESLDWYVDVPSSIPTTYRAPSWSWASVDAAISMLRKSESDIPLISVLSTEVKSVGSDSAGQVLDGIIIVKGCHFLGDYVPPGSPGYEEIHRSYPKIPRCNKHALVYPDHSDVSLESGVSLHYMPVTCHLGKSANQVSSLYGLILQPVSLILHIFKRVGRFSLGSGGSVGGFKVDKNKSGFWELHAEEGISKGQLTIV